MRTLADLIRIKGAINSKGGQDTITAHINPQEAMLLKMLGGSGRVDPDTGFLHFEDSGEGYDGGLDGSDPDDSSPSGPSDQGPGDVDGGLDGADPDDPGPNDPSPADPDGYNANPSPAPSDLAQPGLDLSIPDDPVTVTSLTPAEITGYTQSGAPGSQGTGGWGSIGNENNLGGVDAPGAGMSGFTWGGLFSPPEEDKENQIAISRTVGQQPGLWGVEGFVHGAQPTTGLTGLINSLINGRNSPEQAGKGWQVAQQIENVVAPTALAAINPALAGLYSIGRGVEQGRAGPAVGYGLNAAFGPATSLAGMLGRSFVANFVDTLDPTQAAINSALGYGRGQVGNLGAQIGFDALGPAGAQLGGNLGALGFNAAANAVASAANSPGGGQSAGGQSDGEGGGTGDGQSESISGMVASVLGDSMVSNHAVRTPVSVAGIPAGMSIPSQARQGQMVNAMFDGSLPILDIPDYMPTAQPNVRPQPIGSSFAQPSFAPQGFAQRRQLSDLLRR